MNLNILINLINFTDFSVFYVSYNLYVSLNLIKNFYLWGQLVL